MIHLNLITHTKGVLCNRCYEEIKESVMRKVHERKRFFRESVTNNYFGFPGNFKMDVAYEVEKQWSFRLPRLRVFITVMRKIF